jgi:hypothetical protein
LQIFKPYKVVTTIYIYQQRTTEPITVVMKTLFKVGSVPIFYVYAKITYLNIAADLLKRTKIKQNVLNINISKLEKKLNIMWVKNKIKLDQHGRPTFSNCNP